MENNDATDNEEVIRPARTFADVAVTGENYLEKMAEEEASVTIYTYLHKRTRSFHVGEFSFEEYILRVRGDKLNQKWIDTYLELPIEERSQIVEYHPELISQIERPVGSAVVRGAVATSQIPDKKVVTGGLTNLLKK